MTNPEITRLKSDQTFNFNCFPEISCFNHCCQNLQQVLSPYDIIRLKRHFNSDSTTFLQTYTITDIGPETGLPVVMLKNKSQTDLHCIFVSENGCLVYPDRPSTCRYYPMGRVVSKSRQTCEKSASYIMIHEPHCKGHEYLCHQNLQQWRNSQELPVFDQTNDLMIDLISAKSRSGLKKLSDDQRYLIYIGCYDIDAFRQYTEQQNLFSGQAFPDSLEGDIQWVECAIRWLETVVIK